MDDDVTDKDELTKLLGNLNDEITTFNAKNLNLVTGELDGVIKKRDAAVASYGDKYAELQARWRWEHDAIKERATQLQNLFPDNKWKEVIVKHVCPTRNDVAAKAQAVEARWTQQGALELALRNTKRDYEAAKAVLDALLSNGPGLDGALKANKDRIAEIDAAYPGPDAKLAVYLLFIVVLPAHRRMAIKGSALADLPQDTPETLCAPAAPRDRRESGSDADQAPTAAEAPAAASTAAATEAEPGPGPAPRLIPVDAYSKAIDAAYIDYKTKREAFEAARAAFAAAPDDLASLVKTLADSRASQDADIRTALKAAAA